MKNDNMNNHVTETKKTNIALGGAAAAGVGACATGTTAAILGTATVTTTAGVSAATVTGVGAAIGGTIGTAVGGLTGTSVGIATCGVGLAGTVPLAVTCGSTGAAIGGATATTVAGWLGIPIATTATVVTAPVWAVPVAVAGGVLALGSMACWMRKKLKKSKSSL